MLNECSYQNRLSNTLSNGFDLGYDLDFGFSRPNSKIAVSQKWQGWLTLTVIHNHDRDFWWPMWGIRFYRIVTGVTSDVDSSSLGWKLWIYVYDGCWTRSCSIHGTKHTTVRFLVDEYHDTTIIITHAINWVINLLSIQFNYQNNTQADEFNINSKVICFTKR